MSDCWCGVSGADDVLSTTFDIVKPAGAGTPQSPAETVPISRVEAQMFSMTPLACASFPAIALRLPAADPALLKSSLAVALGRHRVMAGRLRGEVAELSDEGAPFTIAENSRPSAPTRLREADLLRLADFRRAPRVAAGLEPPMTVRLTRFRDGSAVLTFCRSHVVMDGSSAWAFLGDWARAARGEPLVAGRADGLEDGVPDREELEVLWEERFGEPLSTRGAWLKMKALKSVFAVAAPLYDFCFLSGATGDLERPRLSLSDDDLAAIKAAATPSTPGSWVSTQEALAAYLVHTVGRACLPASSRGRVAITLILDPRKALGRRPEETFGSGLVFLTWKFEGLLQMSLRDVAGKLHDAAQSELSLKEAGRTWRIMNGCFRAGAELAMITKMIPRQTKHDLILVLNNQSKRELPDFGAASGGRADAVVTNAGPTVVLPVPSGGVDVLLDPSTVLRPARSARDRAEALAALRAAVPLGGRAGGC